MQKSTNKTYYIDTNIILRYLVGDNRKMYIQSELYFKKAQESKVKLIVCPEVIFESVYILNKVYRLSKNEISNMLISLVKMPYIKVESRSLMLDTLMVYEKFNIDLVDIFLYLKAKSEGAKVLSFDKDLKKLERFVVE